MNILEEEELPSKNVLMSTKRRAGSVIWAWIAAIVIAIMLLQHAASPSPGVIIRMSPPYEQSLVGVGGGCSTVIHCRRVALYLQSTSQGWRRVGCRISPSTLSWNLLLRTVGWSVEGNTPLL